MKHFKLLLIDALIENLLNLLELDNFESFSPTFIDFLEHLLYARRDLRIQ